MSSNSKLHVLSVGNFLLIKSFRLKTVLSLLKQDLNVILHATTEIGEILSLAYYFILIGCINPLIKTIRLNAVLVSRFYLIHDFGPLFLN